MVGSRTGERPNRLAGTVADALRHGGVLPSSSRVSNQVPPGGLSEAEIAHHPETGHVRVLGRDAGD